jgi:hypothetical protein
MIKLGLDLGLGLVVDLGLGLPDYHCSLYYILDISKLVNGLRSGLGLGVEGCLALSLGD